ncbi:ABC transporter ATP-binding protein, partial [Faecalibacterium prausnitzii]|nr:ABC transporter ATP-binding protein [Faecalibacterium prausnitzii]
GLAQVPEWRHVLLHMTVDENLYMGAYTQPASTIADNKEKVFTLFPRLKDRRKQLAGTMSGGEQQILSM